MGEKAMSFLNNKSFHPGNAANRAKIFEAEVKKKSEDEKKEQLRREFAQQQQQRETKSMLRGGDAVAEAGMSFMYDKPPGYVEAQNRQKREEEKTKAERDAERFPILENAPRQGAYTNDMDVSHKPFGVELKKTRCKRCGNWGHSMGDRECPLRNQESDASKDSKAREDPLARAAGGEASGVPLRWMPLAAAEDRVHGGVGTADDANQQFLPLFEEEEQLAMAAAAAAAAGGGEVAMADLDPAVLALLSDKQRRRLLKMYQKEQLRSIGGNGDEAKDGERKRKKHKSSSSKEKRDKHSGKKRKHRHRGKSSSESSSDSDGGDAHVARH